MAHKKGLKQNSSYYHDQTISHVETGDRCKLWLLPRPYIHTTPNIICYSRIIFYYQCGQSINTLSKNLTVFYKQSLYCNACGFDIIHTLLPGIQEVLVCTQL